MPLSQPKDLWEHDCLRCGKSFDLKHVVARCKYCKSMDMEVRRAPPPLSAAEVSFNVEDQARRDRVEGRTWALCLPHPGRYFDES